MDRRYRRNHYQKRRCNYGRSTEYFDPNILPDDTEELPSQQFYPPQPIHLTLYLHTMPPTVMPPTVMPPSQPLQQPRQPGPGTVVIHPNIGSNPQSTQPTPIIINPQYPNAGQPSNPSNQTNPQYPNGGQPSNPTNAQNPPQTQPPFQQF